MNLAWTGPVDNQSLEEAIPYDKVVAMAMDLFIETSEAAKVSSTAVAASAEGEEIKLGKPAPSVAEVLNQEAEKTGKRSWKIPAVVEKGYEIPICITSLGVIPEIGKFRRLGMCVVVNAVWLAYAWAKDEQNEKAIADLEHLILDWPMDFIRIEGNSPEEIEENSFKWTANMSAKHERLREFVGLECANLMRIVAKASSIVQSKKPGKSGRARKMFANGW